MVMSPKSLLRHKLAVSDISELDKGTSFVPVIDEIDSEVKASAVKRVIFCAGKVYYDLLEKRREAKKNDVAIVRLEQLYPFPEEMIVKMLKKYTKATKYVWAQEEPRNMGCWRFIRAYLEESLLKSGVKEHIGYVGRIEASSPAVGYMYVHNKQQETLVHEALGLKLK
jgi:2-oxoglutarate dehydrogenase E1 component